MSACAGAQEGGSRVSACAHADPFSVSVCAGAQEGGSCVIVCAYKDPFSVSACAGAREGGYCVSKAAHKGLFSVSASAGAQEGGSCVRACAHKDFFSVSARAGAREGGSCVSVSACKGEGTLFVSTRACAHVGGLCVSKGGSATSSVRFNTEHDVELCGIFGLRDNLANRENEPGLQDAAGVSPPADKCTPGFSPRCFLSPQECRFQDFMAMTPPLGSGSSLSPPQRLLPQMDLVATNSHPSLDFLTISQFLKNSDDIVNARR